MCVPQMARAPKVARLRELKCLTLGIIEAHRLPYKLVPNPMCIVSLNQVKVAKTKVKSGYDPTWDEEITLEYAYLKWNQYSYHTRIHILKPFLSDSFQ